MRRPKMGLYRQVLVSDKTLNLCAFTSVERSLLNYNVGWTPDIVAGFPQAVNLLTKVASRRLRGDSQH